MGYTGMRFCDKCGRHLHTDRSRTYARVEIKPPPRDGRFDYPPPTQRDYCPECWERLSFQDDLPVYLPGGEVREEDIPF